MAENQSKRKISHRLTIGARREIVDLYKKGKSVKEIMALKNCTYKQVYDTLTGKRKLNYSPRADKGKRRAKKNFSDGDTKTMDFSNFKDVDEFLEYQLLTALKELNEQKKMIPGDRIRLLKDISIMQKNLELRKLEKWIKRPEAHLIAQIIRRFKPETTDDEVIKIYREEYEKFVRE